MMAGMGRARGWVPSGEGARTTTAEIEGLSMNHRPHLTGKLARRSGTRSVRHRPHRAEGPGDASNHDGTRRYSRFDFRLRLNPRQNSLHNPITESSLAKDTYFTSGVGSRHGG